MGSNPIGALFDLRTFEGCSLKLTSFMTVNLLAVLSSSFTFKSQMKIFFLI